MKILNTQDLEQIAIGHMSNINSKDFMKLYENIQ